MYDLKEMVWTQWKRLNTPNVLVAVSGGSDSVGLAYIMSELKKTFAKSLYTKVVLGHVDHALRDSSKNDAEFTVEMADRLDLSLMSYRLTAEEADWVREQSSEDMFVNEFGNSIRQKGVLARARVARYNKLNEMADQAGCDLIAVAHTADDQAETFMIQLMRGTNPHGIMRQGPGRLWRPLLDAARSDIRGMLNNAELSWVDDPSNENEKYLRVFVRKRLLPLMESVREGVTKTIANRAEWQAEQDIITYKAAEKLVSFHNEKCSLFPRADIKARDPVIIEAIRQCIAHVSEETPSRGEIESVKRIIYNPGKKAIFRNGSYAKCHGFSVWFYP